MKLDLTINPFEKLDKQWALVTAGTKEAFNSMTISWGGFGVLWYKNVATIYIRPTRHTFKFLKENENFTISFYDEQYRKDLTIMGTKSGKDCDKLKETSLTPKFLSNAITYKQANLTLVCKKLYLSKFNEKDIPEEIKTQFDEYGKNVHYIIIGEIIKQI